MVAPLSPNVPRDTLQIGEERMTDTRDPMTADGIPLPLQTEHVRSPEEMVMHDRSAKPISQRESPLEARFSEHATPEDVLVACCRRVRLAPSQTRVEDRRHFVYRLDFDTKAARRLRDGSNVRGGKVRLRAKQTLGFRETEVRARLADLEGHESFDHPFARRRVMEAKRTRHSAPDPHVATERRPLRAHNDRPDGVAVTRHRRRDRIGVGSLRDGLNSRDESEEMMR
jgi:hypothetical protein